MRNTFSAGFLVGALFLPSAASAWWDEGHMRIAAMAYELLTPAARTEANRLTRLNPKYAEWASAVPATPDGSPKDVDRYTFIRAAVWADDIKEMKEYRDASSAAKDAPTHPNAGQNIGYSDLLIHAYWHYKDIPFSNDGSPLADADAVNALTQIKMFTAALPKTAGQSDDVRSYDLVWLLHLLGDVHQPLHATARFTKELRLKYQLAGTPDLGDRGGNDATVSPATGEIIPLHAYWDGLFGGYSTVSGAIFDSFVVKKVGGEARNISKLLPPTPESAAVADPELWLEESYQIARKYAYAEPVLSAKGVAELGRQYETDARNAAETQISLAGARLANVINAVLDAQ
ncbi:hypothetical protein M2360_000775 [Rhizobium sp. SG_E_25_P2]|uniref:S1/P1 nuclease n=1 Tax=Rhizobium sp. SG_E_25_P2 TaxID=2879942 RepID=UPI00247498D5|nr:S1/P1 nuclease [Rhizobium sp. SG_E_25_P2]MDH6265394.1 hypothetical protein [Rhizobium sp. SG_E_25_P2]